MLDKGLLLQLDEAFAQQRAAEDRIVAICVQIAGGPAPAGPAEGPSLREAQGGRVVTLGQRRRSPKATGQVSKSWQKAACSRCGAVTGSRIIDQKRYPMMHNDQTGALCPGWEQAAQLATAQQIKAAREG
jgi:hypothetical protein